MNILLTSTGGRLRYMRQGLAHGRDQTWFSLKFMSLMLWCRPPINPEHVIIEKKGELWLDHITNRMVKQWEFLANAHLSIPTFHPSLWFIWTKRGALRKVLKWSIGIKLSLHPILFAKDPELFTSGFSCMNVVIKSSISVSLLNIFNSGISPLFLGSSFKLQWETTQNNYKEP